VFVGVSVGVGVGVFVGVSVGVSVGVGVGVFVGVSVGVLVGVFVGVSVGVFVSVIVGVSVGVLVGVRVGVLVGVGVKVGHFGGRCLLGIQPAVGIGFEEVFACTSGILRIPSNPIKPRETNKKVKRDADIPVSLPFAVRLLIVD
jgi:hypothetical protein